MQWFGNQLFHFEELAQHILRIAQLYHWNYQKEFQPYIEERPHCLAELVSLTAAPEVKIYVRMISQTKCVGSDHFKPMFHFYTPWKHFKTLYKSETFAWSRLILYPYHALIKKALFKILSYVSFKLHVLSSWKCKIPSNWQFSVITTNWNQTGSNSFKNCSKENIIINRIISLMDDSFFLIIVYISETHETESHINKHYAKICFCFINKLLFK